MSEMRTHWPHQKGPAHGGAKPAFAAKAKRNPKSKASAKNTKSYSKVKGKGRAQVHQDADRKPAYVQPKPAVNKADAALERMMQPKPRMMMGG